MTIGETRRSVQLKFRQFYLATQCPIAGGPAVYRSRAMYVLIDPMMSYNDENTCLQAGYLFRNSRNITSKSKLYPNPASNEVTIVYNTEKDAIFEIIDLVGRIVMISDLS